MKPNRLNGFTLVELLVVISIIALLVSILMPALSKAREQAVGLVCQTRFKDIGVMMHLYMMDHDDQMVSNSYVGGGGHRWPTRLGDYYNMHDTAAGNNVRYNTEMFYCPKEWTKRRQHVASGSISPINSGFMYELNGFLADSGTSTVIKGKFTKSSSWQQPAELPVLHDTNSDVTLLEWGNWDQMYPSSTLFEHGWNGGVNNPTERLSYRFGPAANHGVGINYLFADMHVKRTMWPYKDTLDVPESKAYYQKFWHPRRDLSIKAH